MLPVNTGFIFPNEEILDTGVLGHCRCAFQFIREKGWMKEFLNSKIDSEDDFLIENRGAVKVCHYFGEDYIYVPEPHNDYIESIKKIYVANGYTVIKYHSNYSGIIKIDGNESDNMKRFDISRMAYNQTVVRGIEGEYIYNPRRNGD